jgi:hypothetical protein
LSVVTSFFSHCGTGMGLRYRRRESCKSVVGWHPFDETQFRNLAEGLNRLRHSQISHESGYAARRRGRRLVWTKIRWWKGIWDRIDGMYSAHQRTYRLG